MALIAVTATPARDVPRYQLVGRPGAVSAVTILPRGGGRIVADHLLDRPALIASERINLTQQPAPAGTCAAASAARPFTRLRRFAADGRLVWTWDLTRERTALRLLGQGINDCLSPDGTRLLVAVYGLTSRDLAPQNLLIANAVIAVGRSHGFVQARPRPGREPFGNPRRTAPVAWLRGKPATISYETGIRLPDASGTEQVDYSIPPGPRR